MSLKSTYILEGKNLYQSVLAQFLQKTYQAGSWRKKCAKTQPYKNVRRNSAPKKHKIQIIQIFSIMFEDTVLEKKSKYLSGLTLTFSKLHTELTYC